MIGTRAWLLAAVAAPLVVACASSGGMIESRDPKVLQSKASVSDLVLCLKGRLKDDATVIAYPEPGRVDIRIADGGQADAHYFHVVGLSQARNGTRVEIRSADEWHPLMSASKVAGIVEDCKSGTAR